MLIKTIPAGDAGLLIDTDVPPSWLADAIDRARLPGVVDVVPGASTVLVITEPGRATGVARAELTARITALPVHELAGSAQEVIEIPVSYDGPDLEEVARLTAMSVRDVIGRHSGVLYTVGWLGFSPGFGYLTGLDPRLAVVGRLESPRLAVPAGSVAIAAGLAAVYPSESPGGWRILGSTTSRMWDPDREPPALLAPGRHLRFVPVRPSGRRRSRGRRTSAQPRPADLAPPTAGSGPPAADLGPAAAGPRRLEVIRPGPLATVQDLGRPGLGAVGVPSSGAADPASLIAANRLVGNPDDAAGIELTLGRAAFRCRGDLTIAITGAPATLTLSATAHTTAHATAHTTAHATGHAAGHAAGQTAADHAGTQAAAGTPLSAPDGTVVSIGPPEAGLRTYLAVAGGVAVPTVLGSRSTDLLSGLGGDPLKPGSTLPIGADIAGPSRSTEPSARSSGARGSDTTKTGGRLVARGGVAELRVVGGPRLDWFVADALDALCADAYVVTPASNRTGLRLDGQPLRRRGDAELPSEGLVTGSLQVPPSGKPILLLADHPTVGGYPVAAVVVTSDIGLAAQLRPGAKIKFLPVSAG